MRSGTIRRAALRRGQEPAPAAAWPARPLSEPLRRRLTLAAMCVATFMIQLDVTIVNVALPSIQRDLQVSPGALEWVISGYALSLAALIPVSGALGDRYGGGGSSWRASSSSRSARPPAPCRPVEIALVAFRVLQGAGGAAMLALTLSIITETFPPANRAAAIGTWAAVGGTGSASGRRRAGSCSPSSAGRRVLGEPPVRRRRDHAHRGRGPPRPAIGSGRRLDLPGAAASAVGLFAVTLGLTESASHSWRSWPVAAPITVGVAIAAGFLEWERRCPHAMIPPALLRPQLRQRLGRVPDQLHRLQRGAVLRDPAVPGRRWLVAARNGLSWLL